MSSLPSQNDLNTSQIYNPYGMLPPQALGGVPLQHMQHMQMQHHLQQQYHQQMQLGGHPTGMDGQPQQSPLSPQHLAQSAMMHSPLHSPPAQQFPAGQSPYYNEGHHPMAGPSTSQSSTLGPGASSPYNTPTTPNTPNAMTSAAGTIRKRRFSSAKIQPTRIKKVMQSDEEIGRMVASVPVAIGRAMEHFAEKFLLAAAAAVAGTNGRTLSPMHMKLAMLANPHFKFLEPLLADIGVPHKQLQDIPYNVCQLPPSVSHPGHPFAAGAGHLNVLGQSQPAPAPISRRTSSGPKEKPPRPDLAPGEKPKRGRPRKIKKEEKCIDDDLANIPTERELMPPPMLPIPRMGGEMGGNAFPTPVHNPAPPVQVQHADKDRCLMPPPPLPMRPPLHYQNNLHMVTVHGANGEEEKSYTNLD